MPAKLERLPTEILQQISALLDSVQTVSLLAFARASKHCYSVASAILFRTVKVAIADPEGGAPFQFVQGLHTRLLRDDAFKHVRRLILCPTDHFNTPVDWPYTTLETCERGFEDDTGLISCWDVLADQWERNEGTIVEHEWEPVISLVEHLPGLADLYWVCPERLPLRLLELLDSKLRLCRLHHYTFKLENPTESFLTSYYHALITSPSLYSIGSVDKDTATLESARNIRSPNLRRVHLLFDSDTIQRKDWDTVEHQSQKKQDLVPREVIDMQCLGETPIPFSIVLAEALGDWSALRVLALHQRIDARDLPPPGDFPSLETLVYTCAVDEYIIPLNKEVTPWDNLSAFLRNLPRLVNLEIHKWDRSISFTPALNSNLRTLILKTWDAYVCPRVRDDHIHQLADLCPNLESLNIEIRRSRGDASEVARYRSLGRLARLQELIIHLDASVPECIEAPADGSLNTTYDTAIERWFDQQDAEYLPDSLAPYRQGHVRDALINGAIDEDLARAIFQVISNTKLKVCGSYVGKLSTLPLEWLDLRASIGCFTVPGIPHFFSFREPMRSFSLALSQQWTIERDIRDDAREVIHAHKVKEFDIVLNQGDQRAEFDRVKDDPYWFPIWRRVWPAENEGVNWWEDWKSRPLALGDGSNHEAG